MRFFEWVIFWPIMSLLKVFLFTSRTYLVFFVDEYFLQICVLHGAA